MKPIVDIVPRRAAVQHIVCLTICLTMQSRNQICSTFELTHEIRAAVQHILWLTMCLTMQTRNLICITFELTHEIRTKIDGSTWTTLGYKCPS